MFTTVKDGTWGIVFVLGDHFYISMHGLMHQKYGIGVNMLCCAWHILGSLVELGAKWLALVVNRTLCNATIAGWKLWICWRSINHMCVDSFGLPTIRVIRRNLWFGGGGGGGDRLGRGCMSLERTRSL